MIYNDNLYKIKNNNNKLFSSFSENRLEVLRRLLFLVLFPSFPHLFLIIIMMMIMMINLVIKCRQFFV